MTSNKKKWLRWGALPLAAVLMTATVLLAQTFSYRFSGNGLIFSGPGSGFFTEAVYNGGPDSGFARLGAGQLGAVNGGINFNPNAVITPPPIIALATATTGGTIADATYRAVLIYVTPTGGQTNVAAAGEATQATSGGGLSTLTATAPIAAAGAAGYVVAVSPGGGATLTETLQPMSTAVCAGAFAVQSALVVCPFGVNAVMTSLVTGQGIPLQNSAAFPAAVPQLICNLLPQTANVTITTIQTMGSCVLGPGIQNVSGKLLRVTGHGVYTTATQTGTMTISVTEGGQTPIAITSAAIITGGQTNQGFNLDYYVTTSLTGSSGKVEAHGALCVNVATGTQSAIAMACSQDTNTAASSAFNLTASNTLAIAITMTTSTTSATLRDAQVWLLN
jgi:hypothetical protein